MSDVIASGLGELELPARVGRWRKLIEGSARERAVTNDGVRISFRADPATTRELSELVAAERECCDGADWRLEESPQELVLRVVTSADGVATLRQLTGVAQAGGLAAPQPRESTG